MMPDTFRAGKREGTQRFDEKIGPQVSKKKPEGKVLQGDSLIATRSWKSCKERRRLMGRGITR